MVLRLVGRRSESCSKLPAMGLEAYKRKRHFERTPEPPARKAARRRRVGMRFVVQKHRARRLHYDVRPRRRVGRCRPDQGRIPRDAGPRAAQPAGADLDRAGGHAPASRGSDDLGARSGRARRSPRQVHRSSRGWSTTCWTSRASRAAPSSLSPGHSICLPSCAAPSRASATTSARASKSCTRYCRAPRCVDRRRGAVWVSNRDETSVAERRRVL